MFLSPALGVLNPASLLTLLGKSLVFPLNRKGGCFHEKIIKKIVTLRDLRDPRLGRNARWDPKPVSLVRLEGKYGNTTEKVGA